ncbi:MAG: nuclear transport factor 2 family protein [Bradyrhizobium sp.]
MIASLNHQRVLNFLEAFVAGDIEGALSFCADDVDCLASAPIDILPHMGHHHGKAEARKLWQTIYARYDNLRHEVRTIVAEDDKVAVDLRAFFRKRTNQRIVQFDMAAFYTLRDGRIRQIREIIDTFDLVQQVLEIDLGGILAGMNPDGR